MMGGVEENKLFSKEIKYDSFVTSHYFQAPAAAEKEIGSVLFSN